MSQKFEPGELVNVRIDGVRYNGELAGDHLMYQFRDESELTFEVPAACAHVERVAPKEWPPQAGDVWTAADGDDWFAQVAASSDAGVIVMRSARTGTYTSPEIALASYGPLALVRRRGWTPDAPPAAPTPAEVDKRAEKVAGLRAFADLLESRPDVPLPYGINGQVGFRGEEGLAEALRVAASLGVELDAGHDTGHEVQRWARSVKLDLGADVTLTLYAYGLDAPPVPPVDCCPDAEPGDPAEVGGETVKDAEATS